MWPTIDEQGRRHKWFAAACSGLFARGLNTQPRGPGETVAWTASAGVDAWNCHRLPSGCEHFPSCPPRRRPRPPRPRPAPGRKALRALAVSIGNYLYSMRETDEGFISELGTRVLPKNADNSRLPEHWYFIMMFTMGFLFVAARPCRSIVILWFWYRCNGELKRLGRLLEYKF